MIILILGSVFFCLYDILLFYLTSFRLSKKANYDCSKCKDWHCNAHWCESKRKKLQNMG